MPQRLRQRVKTISGGSAYRILLGNVIVNQQQGLEERKFSTCEDVVGEPHIDHNLKIDHIEKEFTPLSGTNYSSSSTYRRYAGWLPTAVLNSAVAHVTDSSYPTETAMATQILAETNPGRADVSIPVFLAELKDIPHMLRGAGDILAGYRTRNLTGQHLAEAHLNAEFGWKPLIGDVKKMFNFAALVNRRIYELQRLNSKGGLKRRMKLAASGRAQDYGNVTVDSTLGNAIVCRKTAHTTRESWGTVRWKPNTLPSLIPLPKLTKQAKQLVYGLNPKGVDLWNVIPWTWFVDWFLNVGQYLEATNNELDVTPSKPCIMTTTRTVISYQRVDLFPYYTGGSATVRAVSKTRGVTGAGLAASDVFLSARQLSILSALSVLRHRRRST